jgi:hypothetical protein
MEKSLRIVINQDIDSKVYDIFEEYFNEAYDKDTFYPVCLRKTIIALYDITKSRKNPFSDNVYQGIMYLYRTEYYRICEKCDKEIIVWLFQLAKSWLRGSELPKYEICTCS